MLSAAYYACLSHYIMLSEENELREIEKKEMCKENVEIKKNNRKIQTGY